MKDKDKRIVCKIIDDIFLGFGVLLFVIGVLNLFEYNNELTAAFIKVLPITIGGGIITIHILDMIFKR